MNLTLVFQCSKKKKKRVHLAKSKKIQAVNTFMCTMIKFAKYSDNGKL
jgi:hypothetical protein